MDTITIYRRERIFQNSGNGMFQVWHLYLLPRGGFHKLSDDQPVNQFPFSIKAQATADGFRVTAHAYGESMEKVISDCANMVSKELVELELRELVIAANQRKVAVEKVKAKK